MQHYKNELKDLHSSSATVYSSKTKAAEGFHDRLDMGLGGRKTCQQ
jgi:hypothetical protein